MIPAHPPAFRSFAAPYLASQARSTRAVFAPRLRCTRACFVPSLHHRAHRKRVRLTVASPRDVVASAPVSFLRCAIPRITRTLDSCSLCSTTLLHSRTIRPFVAPSFASQARPFCRVSTGWLQAFSVCFVRLHRSPTRFHPPVPSSIFNPSQKSSPHHTVPIPGRVGT